MQAGNSSIDGIFATKAADIDRTATLAGIAGTYVGKDTESSQPTPVATQPIKEQVTEVYDFEGFTNNNYSNINEAVVGTANASASINIEWEKTTIEERTEFVNQLLKNVQEEYNLLENQYKTTYGKGIDVLNYSYESLSSILILLSCGNLYSLLSVGPLGGMYTGDGNLDIEILGQIVEKVSELGFIEKMQAYINGASWEESGLSTIYTNSEYGDPEQAFLYNICFSCGDIVGFYDLDDQDIDIKAVKEKLKDYFKSNDTFNTYNNIQKDLIDAQTMQSDLQILGMNVYRIEQMAKLFPFEAVEENSDFSSYLEKDYTNYTRMNQNNLHYLNQREVAIYDYLYDKNPSDAQKYLIALEDTINQRKGMEEATKFINSIAENGGDVGDLFITGWEGLEDGTVNFVDGIIDFFTADGIINASEYEMMYKASILSSALQDSENFTEEFKNASKEYIENIPGWYRSVLSFNYSSWQSIGNMLIPSVVSFIPVVGKPIGLASMGISSAGNAAEGAMQNGASGTKAYLYGLGVGLSETVLTNFIGGIPGLSNLSEQFIKNAINEAGEEFIQTWIDAGLRASILQESIELEDTAFESLYSALQGFVVSGTMQGGQGLAFKIGNEIVYWSDSEFNSLSELLQTKRFTSDMELEQELYKLYKEGTISESKYKTLVSSEQRAQIESANGEGTNNEGSNNDPIVNVDNNLANTIEALEEESEGQIINVDEDNSEVASTEEIVDSNIYNQSEYEDSTQISEEVQSQEIIVEETIKTITDGSGARGSIGEYKNVTPFTIINGAETYYGIPSKSTYTAEFIDDTGIKRQKTYYLSGSIKNGQALGAIKHIAQTSDEAFTYVYRKSDYLNLLYETKNNTTEAEIIKLLDERIAAVNNPKSPLCKEIDSTYIRTSTENPNDMEKQMKINEAIGFKRLEQLESFEVTTDKLQTLLKRSGLTQRYDAIMGSNSSYEQKIEQLHFLASEGAAKIYAKTLDEYAKGNYEEKMGVPIYIDPKVDEKPYYIEILTRPVNKDKGEDIDNPVETIKHMLHKNKEQTIEKAAANQGKKTINAVLSTKMDSLIQEQLLTGTISTSEICKSLTQLAINDVESPGGAQYIAGKDYRTIAIDVIKDIASSASTIQKIKDRIEQLSE